MDVYSKAGDPGTLVGSNEREESVLEEMQVECRDSNRVQNKI